jgi:predicted ATPase/signal transduction histidine kinase/CheY-like chemotaxis protein/HPt (histidine-containing phosphotransfer) domain-containing protein
MKSASDKGSISLAAFFALAAQAIAALQASHLARPYHGCINTATLDWASLHHEDVAPRFHDWSADQQHVAYISPEQTGRMNRGVDYRSDYYSLGVIFYEILTGTLPFESDDEMELVHQHIARQPSPLHQRRSDIPQTVSDIVLKLMSKNAEDRYQSLEGLAADLQQCEQALSEGRPIPKFMLGKFDQNDILQIPQKLYGRNNETKILHQALNRCIVGDTELLLVNGYAGVGKSSLVGEIQKACIEKRGIYLVGKFDQFRRDIPYASLVKAFQSFVRQILGDSEEQVTYWRDAILAAIGGNGQLLIDVIPALEFVIGPQPAVAKYAAKEAQDRFLEVFRQFVSAIAHAEHPLVLFLDDLQWVDAGSMKLLDYLLSQSELRHLLLIGAYRQNEIDAGHPLTLSLVSLRQRKGLVHEITLSALTLEDVTCLITDTLSCDSERALPLATLVHEKTAGNPFFTRQFLLTLYEEKLLTLNTQADSSRVWKWNIARIHAKGITDNVVELMVEKLQRLPAAALDLLKYLACLGNGATIPTLGATFDCSERDVEILLNDALRVGLLMRDGDAIKFGHNRIHEAAYSMIARDVRSSMHLTIGRVLHALMEQEDDDEAVFDVAHQFNSGLDLIHELEEIDIACQLNIRAGKKAKASAAYASAKSFFAQATALLPPQAWSADRYEETFSLIQEYADCDIVLGHFVEAEALFDLILDNVRSETDRVRVARLQMRMYLVTNRMSQGLALGLEALRLYGVSFAETDKELMENIEPARQALTHQLADKRIADLMELPIVDNPEISMIIGLMTDLLTAAYSVRPALVPSILLKALDLSLKHGNTSDSCVIYSNYGLIVAGMFGDIATGFEFSEMSLRLNARFRDTKVRGRLLYIHGYALQVKRQPMAACFATLEEGVTSCREVGNILFYAASYDALVWLNWESGKTLEEVQIILRTYLELAKQTRYPFADYLLRIIEQGITRVQGVTMDGCDIDYLALLTNAGYGYAVAHYHVMQQMVHFILGRYDDALVAAESASKVTAALQALASMTTHHFYYALTLAALYNQANPERQEAFKQTINNQLSKLKHSAENCPESYQNRYCLVAAELARIEGREIDAEYLYEEAISSARENGFMQNEAMACELAARFYRTRGFATTAAAYMAQARAGYLKWGAHGKLAELDREFPRGASERRINNAVGLQFDSMAMLKAYQAISGEIQLGKLLNTLIRIVVETAGAEQGCLLLMHNDAMQLAAEVRAGTRSGEFEIMVPAEPTDVNPDKLPERIVSYVVRTRETVLLADASHASGDVSNFATDPYVTTHSPRSLLCMPILKQGGLVGILYLENRLAVGAFTPAHVSTLELLVLQAAIAIENAQVYNEIEDRVKERTRALSAEITERRRVEDELVQAKVRAEEATQSKSIFLANMSHEIRTPMNAVIGLSHLALGTSLNERQRDYITKIHRAGSSLLGLINDILDSSKIEADKIDLEQADFTLSRVVDTVVAVINHKVEEKGLALNIRIPPQVPQALIGDSLRLGQILTNLLNNAIKFTEAGEVTLNASWLEQSGDRIRLGFSVQDSGIGMTEEQIGKLFHAFSQAEGSTTRKYGGTGLGLSIAKRLVELMSGSIWVDSVPGTGSTFHFTAWFGMGEEAPGIPEAADSSAKSLRLDGTHVLVVEDNDVNQQIVVELLEQFGVSTEVAENGLVGLNKVLAEPGRYDAVLMDMQMPVMGGLESTQKMREHVSADQLPIIALTANAMPHERRSCLEAGMNDYLTKPIDLKQLASTLARWIKITERNDMRPARVSNVMPVRDTGVGLPEELSPFNLKAALKRVNNNSDLLLKLLLQFHQRYQSSTTELHHLFENAQWADAERLVHTLKGLSATFEIADLPNVAESLETALREHRFEDCPPLIETFSAAFENAIVAVGTLANRSDTEAGEPNVLPFDLQTVIPAIDALEESLAASGIEAVDMAVFLSGRFGMGPIKNLAGTLVAQTAEFDYDSAAETLKGIKKAVMASQNPS